MFLLNRRLIVFLFVAAIAQPLCDAKSKEYLFLQQYVDMCFLAPMINLHKLEALLEKYESLEDASQKEWFSRRQWFGKAHIPLFIWHKAFNRLNNPDDMEVRYVRDFIKSAIQDAPVSPHYYKENGDFYFGKLSMLAPLNYVRFLFTPFLLIDIDSMKQVASLDPIIGLKIPLVQNHAGCYQIYDDISSTYKAITADNIDFGHTFSTRNRFNTLLGDKAFLYDFDFVQIKAQETLGFKAVALTGDLARGLFSQRRTLSESGFHAPQMYGLTKLIYA